MSSIPSWARVGAKVVCIDASVDGYLRIVQSLPGAAGLPPYICDLDGLTKGVVYTIAGVQKYQIGDFWIVELLEISRPVDQLGTRGFHINRFRPLHTLESDLEAHFSQLLDVPAPVHEAAE